MMNEAQTKTSRYQLVKCTIGRSWNVVDCLDVKAARHGKIVGASHRSEAAARVALRWLRHKEELSRALPKLTRKIVA